MAILSGLFGFVLVKEYVLNLNDNRWNMDHFLPSFEWHHTAEGETFLQHLYNGRTSGRKLFGILEKPFQSSNLEEVCYKLVFVGKTGVGKTSTINKVAGISAYSSYFETSGIRVTDVYWPVKVWDKIILFKLQCWDAGSSSMKKYNHIPLLPFIIFLFFLFNMSTVLTSCHVNSQSLAACFDEFQQYFTCNFYHSIAVSETWLKPHIPSSSVSLPDHTFIRHDQIT
ncbi:unnamed protein product [Nezara viridula]|uniref:Ciliogenesis and planar polarity effector 2 n=1 Tax=Nezara viridula TaxID=85310 RepID=A0A9P0EEV4_NEZVI|nr:unnamed protein product [Nezara viridula]